MKWWLLLILFGVHPIFGIIYIIKYRRKRKGNRKS